MAPVHDQCLASAEVQNPKDQSALHHLAADVLLWLIMIASLQGFRLVMIYLFRSEMSPEIGFAQILRCAAAGIPFDVSIASYAIIPSFLLTLVSFFRPVGHLHAGVRTILAVIITSICLGTFVMDVAYFREYHDQFNHWIFGFIYDDPKAILQTIWKSYPVVWLLLIVLAVTTMTLWAGRKVWRWLSQRLTADCRWTTGNKRYITATALVVLMFFGMRGSFGTRPIQMKDAAVTSDPVLNKLVMNPFASLKYALKDHWTLAESKDLKHLLPGGDIMGAAKTCFPQANTSTNLDDFLRVYATGTAGKIPRHIFLIIEESYDAWSMRSESAASWATRRLSALAREGISADAFLSAGDGTMPSVGAILTGLPNASIYVNYQPASRKPFPTSIAPIFKRLGYRTRFFYSGYLSWQRLGDFCLDQGFDEVHGGSEMTQKLSGNEWGVDDSDLFDFVVKSLGDTPSFNVILTTSYHPPFSVDLKSKGFPPPELRDEIAAKKLSSEDLKILGHLWYADQALGNFVDAVQKLCPQSLFAITGDHWSRRTFGTSISVFGRHAVPLVLYGPEVLQNVARPPHIVGSHLDIIPTLVELSAEKGFEYHAFGHNMLTPYQRPIGFGSKAVITPDYILELGPENVVEPLTSSARTAQDESHELRQRHRQLQALAWWRVVKGSQL